MSISVADLKKHVKKDDAWVAIHGQVYDVTSWISIHPGGEHALLAYIGQDATEEWKMIHKPGTIEKCLKQDNGPKHVGILKITEKQPEAKDELVVAMTISVEDLKKHDKKGDAWVVIHGQVYDVTSWIPIHPGGEHALLAYIGQDATEEWKMIHKPGTIEKCLQQDNGPKHVGILKSPEKPPESQEEGKNMQRYALFEKPIWISWFQGDGDSERPTPISPDEFPANMRFMFTRMSAEQAIYLWNIVTLQFGLECCCILAYAGMIRILPRGQATALFSVPFAALSMQSVYALHDTMHGACFPMYDWQKFCIYPWIDFVSVPWEELVLMHNRHHASTWHPEKHQEFGWDPAWLVYLLQDYTWLTAPLIPLAHFLGASYTGLLAATQWFMTFPNVDTDGRLNKDYSARWLPRRIKHQLCVSGCWAAVWLLGTFPLGRKFREGWRFVLPISCAARVGASLAWTGIMNLSHSQTLQGYLEADVERRDLRKWKVIPYMFGGRTRFADIVFSDVHHAFPNAIGTMSQRSRWHGWAKVSGAAMEIVKAGIWKT